MILEVLTHPDPLLKQKSEAITEITPEIRTLAADMIETMYKQQGIGLAAPQVGKQIRLIVIDLSGPELKEEPQVFVNPTLELIGEKQKAEEGCLSVPDYRNTLVRHDKVLLKATDLDNNKIELEASDLFAICLQHECDHLDGILFIDRMSRLKRSLYDARLKKQLKAEKQQ
ncbi:peptide deformylase [Desulfovibrio litoralis]|uniref:Peptide deformylase n=1 Tax=Desulfovibrio litoralis DSM 11393 TaxID=1121455 RepID=A0A1M7RUT0_9BACT|nr:peptide deformylase [Desulfovibrio litoralis]SHN50031.1 peptide deformylase [Desulfovibrio litoralis DSM 11393]